MRYRALFKYLEFLEGTFRPLEAFQQKINSETLKEHGKSLTYGSKMQLEKVFSNIAPFFRLLNQSTFTSHSITMP